MNKLFQELNPSQPLLSNLGNFKKAMQMLKGVNNPTQMLNMAIQQNPQMKDVISLVQNSNMSPKDLFYKMAKEKGINPNDILNQLQ